MNKDNLKGGLVGLSIGVAAGVAAGIILAPKSGKETRADITKKAGQAKDGAADHLKKAEEELAKATAKLKPSKKTNKTSKSKKTTKK